MMIREVEKMKHYFTCLMLAVMASVGTVHAENMEFPVSFSIDGLDFQIQDPIQGVPVVWVSDDEEPYATGTVTIPLYVTNKGVTYIVTKIAKWWPNEGGLTKLVVPMGLDSIDKLALCDTRSLQEVDLKGVKYIGNYAFSGSGLKTLELNGMLKSLGSGVFSLNKELTSVTITSPTLTELPDFTFTYCTKLTDITLSPYITTLGRQVFALNPALETITLPQSLQSMGIEMFYDCTNLREIKVLAYAPPAATAQTFEGIDTEKVKLVVPNGTEPFYRNAEGWKLFKTINNTQGIEELPMNTTQEGKVLHEGHIFLQRGDKTYTLQGQEVK